MEREAQQYSSIRYLELLQSERKALNNLFVYYHPSTSPPSLRLLSLSISVSLCLSLSLSSLSISLSLSLSLFLSRFFLSFTVSLFLFLLLPQTLPIYLMPWFSFLSHSFHLPPHSFNLTSYLFPLFLPLYASISLDTTIFYLHSSLIIFSQSTSLLLCSRFSYPLPIEDPSIPSKDRNVSLHTTQQISFNNIFTVCLAFTPRPIQYSSKQSPLPSNPLANNLCSQQK